MEHLFMEHLQTYTSIKPVRTINLRSTYEQPQDLWKFMEPLECFYLNLYGRLTYEQPQDFFVFKHFGAKTFWFSLCIFCKCFF